MVQANEPLGVTSEYGYDANGELTSHTDPLGHETTYVYDKLGRLTEAVQPLEKTTKYTYDVAGNLASSKAPQRGRMKSLNALATLPRVVSANGSATVAKNFFGIDPGTHFWGDEVLVSGI